MSDRKITVADGRAAGDHAVVRAPRRARGRPPRRRRSRVGAPGARRDPPAAFRPRARSSTSSTRSGRPSCAPSCAGWVPSSARCATSRCSATASRSHADRLPAARSRIGAARHSPTRRRSRRRARPTCSRCCDEPRYEQVRAKLAAAAANPVLHRRGARPRGRRADAASCTRRWKKLRRAVRKLGDNPPDEALHAVRDPRQAVPLRGRSVRARVRQARAPARRARWPSVQDVLGEHHDAVVAVAWLDEDRARVLAGRGVRDRHARAGRTRSRGVGPRRVPRGVAARRHQARPRLAVSKRRRRGPRRGRRRDPDRAGRSAPSSSSCTGRATTTGACPKGKLEPGESFEDAARREIEEETGRPGRAGRAAPDHRVRRPARAPQGRALLADDTGRRQPPGSRTTRSTRRVGLRPPKPRHFSSYEHDRRLVATVADASPPGGTA